MPLDGQLPRKCQIIYIDGSQLSTQVESMVQSKNMSNWFPLLDHYLSSLIRRLAKSGKPSHLTAAPGSMLAGFQSKPSQTRTAEAKERLTSKPQGVEVMGNTPGAAMGCHGMPWHMVTKECWCVGNHPQDATKFCRWKAFWDKAMANFSVSCSPCGWCMLHWFSDQTRCKAPKWDDFAFKAPFLL